MEIIETAITGSEAQGGLETPFQALVQFYHAFNNRDFTEMKANWENSDAISMSNPLGGLKRGWKEIGAIYEHIFSGRARVYVEFYGYTLYESAGMFCAAGRERGFFRLDDKEVTLAIRTSRTFRKVEGRWRQVHHHGSIDAPALLAEYQTAVMGKVVG